MALHTDTSMQVPSTPATWQVGGGAPELLDAEDAELLEEAPPTVSAVSAARSPLNVSTSEPPALPGMPGTVPVALCCQKDHPENGAGTSGQVTPQLATQSCA
jgi:hypothetical protein